MAESYPQRRFALPPDAIEIVIIRHGASAHAVPDEPFDLIDGHADPALAPEGHEQAQRVAQRLRDEPLAKLFVTPLQRTHQTAQPLAEHHRLEPIVINELREVHLGDWEGGEMRIRAAQGDPLFFRILEEERWDVIPGAESLDAFAARVRQGVEEVVAQAEPGTSVAAILHGGVIGEICRQASDSRPFAFVHADNCSITRLVVFGNGRWLVRSFNDTAHL